MPLALTTRCVLWFLMPDLLKKSSAFCIASSCVTCLAFATIESKRDKNKGKYRIKIKLLPRSSSRWHLIGLNRKSAGICICYRPTFGGLSHCLTYVGRQRRSPRLYMQSMRPAIFLPKYRAGCKIITYPRASTVAQSLT